MKSSFKTIILLILMIFLLSERKLALASSLKITDFQKYSNVEQGETFLFYRHIFKQPLTFSAPFFPSENLPNSLATSLGRQMDQQKLNDNALRLSMKKTWYSISTFLKNSITSYVIADLEAAPSSEMAVLALHLTQSKTNSLVPRISAGPGTLKPALSLENIFNTGIRSHVSYHTQEETLEAKLSKKILKNVELHVRNTNIFTDDRVKRILLGFTYRF